MNPPFELISTSSVNLIATSLDKVPSTSQIIEKYHFNYIDFDYTNYKYDV